MDKNFYIKLKSESEYKECISWFNGNLTDDVFTSLTFVEHSWDLFHWEESPKHWCLTQRSTKFKEYSWEGFLNEVVSGFIKASTDDIFTIGKYASALNAPNKYIPRYSDGNGRDECSTYNIRNCSSVTKIINVTEKYFELSNFSGRGWFKKSDILGESCTDMFTIGKNVHDLPIRSVRIQRYRDGRGISKTDDYNLTNCSSDTRIINVTEDYFELSGFSNGWFKKSDIIQKSVPQWYLQYTSEITKELFDKLVDKLDPKKFRQHCNFTMTYENFKESCYIRTGINGDGNSSEWEGKWSIDNNTQSILTSKTLWDFLDKETETKFKVGNWYEYYEGKFYIKFKKLESGGTVWCSEYINLSDSMFIDNSSGCGNITQYTKVIEVPLSQISKYLPDGHPDKIKSEPVVIFEVGKWYEENDKFYFKFSNIEGQKVYCSQFINREDAVHKNYSGSCGYVGDYKIAKEVSPEEYSKYLPDGHPDKIKSEPFVKFEVGKWYEYYDKDKFFFKFKELNGSGYLHCSEHINLRDSEYINSGGGVGRTTDYKAAIEVSSEALSKYLPDGHPDKWITVSLTALNFGETKTMFSGSSIKPLPVFVEPEKPKTKDKEEKPLSLISSKKLKIDFVI